jgi:hypothetical protein
MRDLGALRLGQLNIGTRKEKVPVVCDSCNAGMKTSFLELVVLIGVWAIRYARRS